MTHPEYLAVLRTLRTANFSRSPGLQRRLKRSLRCHPNWELLGVLGLLVGFWMLVWSLL